jgi:protein TonB
MTALQNIIKEAKSLRAKYPKRYSKWTDYVKQASAIYASKHKGKSPVGKKKTTKKKVIKKKVVKKRIVKKTISKKPTEKVILKKVHAAKTTSKNLFNKLDKLDEAQHAHMSKKMGNIKDITFQHLQQILRKIEMNDNYINSIQKLLKEKKYSPLQKNSFKKSMKDYQLYNKELKIQKTELKKLL